MQFSQRYFTCVGRSCLKGQQQSVYLHDPWYLLGIHTEEPSYSPSRVLAIHYPKMSVHTPSLGMYVVTAVHRRQNACMQIQWHRSLDEVPDDLPTVYIAHEFLDALPVHQFQKTERGWCERLVDVASEDSPLHFRLVLAPGPTPASKLLVDRRLAALPFDQSEPSMVFSAARDLVGESGSSSKPQASLCRFAYLHHCFLSCLYSRP